MLDPRLHLGKAQNTPRLGLSLFRQCNHLIPKNFKGGETPFFVQEEEGGPYGDPNIPGMKGPSTKDLFLGPEQIERAKKLHYVLCTKSEDSEASSLHNTLKSNSVGELLTALP